MTLPNYYDTGTISVANGATAVTGTGTAWLNLVKAGDVLRKAGHSVRVASVETENGLTLAEPWPGTSLVAAAYEIEITFAGTEYLLATRRILEQLATGAYAQPDASGTLAERADFGDEAEGFIYWETDVDPFLIFVKNSAASADWSAGVAISQPGPTGATGVGDRYDLAFYDPARPGAGETVFKSIFAAASVNYPAGLTGSVGRAEVAATGDSVFSFRRNGTEFGTLTFAAASTTGVYAAAGSVTFAAGDVLTITAPNPRDATLSGIFGTLAGTR